MPVDLPPIVLTISGLLLLRGLLRAVRAIRFSTLAALCNALECQPGDLLTFDP